MGSYQTEISLIPFLKEYYPILLREFPNSRLIVAGKNPSERLLEVCEYYKNISVIPNPPIMEDVIKDADVYICPTFVGGGLKLRIMDGLKLGLLVLTHEVSARGYEIFHDKGIVRIFKNKESFLFKIKEMKTLLASNSLERKRNQDIYQRHFSFESGLERIDKILKESL